MFRAAADEAYTDKLISKEARHVYFKSGRITMVCLEFSTHLRIFHSFGDVTITSERLIILTYARHL